MEGRPYKLLVQVEVELEDIGPLTLDAVTKGINFFANIGKLSALNIQLGDKKDILTLQGLKGESPLSGKPLDLR